MKVRKVVEILLMRILKSGDFTKATRINAQKYIVYIYILLYAFICNTNTIVASVRETSAVS